jgi:hypothetical protein
VDGSVCRGVEMLTGQRIPAIPVRWVRDGLGVPESDP